MTKSALKSSAARMRDARPDTFARRRNPASENARVRVSHIVLPGHEQNAAEAVAGERIAEFLTRNGWSHQEKIGSRLRWQWKVPTICVVNGRPLLQRQWKRCRIADNDNIVFVSRPYGGGGTGKQIAGLVAVIALAAFAPWAGGVLAGALGFATTGFIASAIGAGLAIGGSLLLSTLFKPKTASQTNSDATDQVAQLYTVQAGGNTARPLQPIPVQYGRLKIIPDYAGPPFSEYEGNDQYLNLLLARGMGKYEVGQVTTDDTEIWNSVDEVSEAFPDVQVRHYNPGETVTLFPTNIVSSIEVSSGLTIEGAYVGGFIANAAGTQANALAIDIVFPGGCFNVSEDTGQIGNATVSLSAEYRPVNGAGAPIGSYANLFSEDFAFATRTPIRLTKKVAVSPGRYEVRMIRTAVDGRDGSVTTIVWAGLRSFIVGAPSSYPCSITAIRIKASAFTQDAARRIGIVQTRILPVWDSELEQWVEQPTRNPWWAFYDAATNSDYGPRRPVSTIDFQTIVTRAAAAQASGRTFDHQFISAVPVPEAFDTILKVDRARHRWSGDRLTAIRDEYRSFPRMLLTDREIIRGTVEIDYALQPDDAADSVILEYLDEDIWRAAEAQYPPNSESFTAEKPARFRIDGIVDREIGYEEAAFLYLQNAKRRVFITLQTEHDGKLLGFGDTIRVQTELPETYGQSGAALNRIGNRITADREIDWTPDDASTQFYYAMRDKRGRQFGPVKCAEVSGDATQIDLDPADLAVVEADQGMTLAQALERADGVDDPSFEIGVGTKRARNCLILNGKPNGDRVTLSLVVNSPDAYPGELSGLPAVPALPVLRDPKIPVIYQLYASFRQGVAEPVVDASWWPAAGAQYYRADVSYDDGLNWTPVYEGISTSLSVVVDRAALRLRVQGVGAERRGPYSTVDLEAPDIKIAPNTVTLESMKEALRYELREKISQIRTEVSNAANLLAELISEQDSANAEDRQSVTTEISRARGLLTAAYSKAITVAVGPDSAVAQAIEQVNAAVGNLDASLQTRFVAGVSPAGALAQYDLRANAESAFAGMSVIAYADGLGGAYGVIRLIGNRIFIEGPDGSMQPFAIFDAGPPPKVYFNADLIAPGSVTIGHLATTVIEAIQASFRIVDAEQIDAGLISARELDSDFAIYNKASVLSSPVNKTLTTYGSGGGGAGPAVSLSNDVVKSVSYHSDKSSVLIFASVVMGLGTDDGIAGSGESFSVTLQVLNQAGGVIVATPMRTALTGASAIPTALNNQIYSVSGLMVQVPVGETITVRVVTSIVHGGFGGLVSPYTYTWKFAQANILFLEPRGI